MNGQYCDYQCEGDDLGVVGIEGGCDECFGYVKQQVCDYYVLGVGDVVEDGYGKGFEVE